LSNPGTPQIFGVPPIISGMGKATNFSFCTHILSIDRNKSPLHISGKVVGCVVRTLKTFQCTHILGASRGLLCDSSAVLSYAYVFTNCFHCFDVIVLDNIIFSCLYIIVCDRYNECSADFERFFDDMALK